MRKEPNRKYQEEIGVVTEVGQEIMVSCLVVFVPSNRHEISIDPVRDLPEAYHCLLYTSDAADE